MKACLIIGDIVKSQKLDKLPEVVRQLKKTLTQINRKHKGSIVGKFVISGGDSFEGALGTPADAYGIYRTICLALRPVRVRCVAAIGNIESLAGGNVLEMTGPVFPRATDALAEISSKRRRPKLFFEVLSGDAERDATVNTIAMLVEALRDDWKDRAYKIAELYGKKNIAQIAKALDTSRLAIYKQLWDHKIEEVHYAELEMERLICEY